MRVGHPLSGRGLILVWVMAFAARGLSSLPTGSPTEAFADTHGPDRSGASRFVLAGFDSKDHGLRAGEPIAFALAVLEREAGRKLNKRQREGVAKAVARAEIEHGFPAALALAIMKQESRFDPGAKGPAGSIGIMQLQPRTGREMARRTQVAWTNEEVLFDPVQNANFGLRYLTDLKKKFGTWEHAIAAYNMGPTKLRRRLSRGPFPRGPYVKKIFGHADVFRERYGR